VLFVCLASPNRSNGGFRESKCVPSSADWQDRFTGMKDWTTDTAKTTFQLLSETLGKAHKTQDPILLKQIDSVREMKRQYERLLLQMRQLVQNIGTVFKTQRDMCALMQGLALQSPDLQEDFNRTTKTLQLVYNNGELLLSEDDCLVRVFALVRFSRCDK
jgi:tRNA U55 pseudouridine synthase TruB